MSTAPNNHKCMVLGNTTLGVPAQGTRSDHAVVGIRAGFAAISPRDCRGDERNLNGNQHSAKEAEWKLNGS